MNSLRECYEGYVIYNFMSYLLNFLNLEMDLEAALEYKPPVNHVFPLCCMEPWPPGRSFVHNCKHGVLQYVVIRPILTFISMWVSIQFNSIIINCSHSNLDYFSLLFLFVISPFLPKVLRNGMAYMVKVFSLKMLHIPMWLLSIIFHSLVPCIVWFYFIKRIRFVESIDYAIYFFVKI